MPDIQSLLSMLQGQGQGQPQGSPLSGQAFPTPLSGLPFGEQGMGLSGGGGSMSGMQGAAPMGGGGGTEGMDPLMLQQLMSAIQMAGTAAGGSLMGGAGGGSLGQYGGGFGGGGGYLTAGPTTQQAGTQAGGTTGGTDLKSALGQLPRLANYASKAFGAGGDLGTRGYVGGQDQLQGPNQSLSDVVRGGGSAAGGGTDVASSLQALQGGKSATDITGALSPELAALFAGGGALPAELGGIGAPIGLGVGGQGAGAAAGTAGAAAGGGAAGGGAGGASLLSTLAPILGPLGAIAGPLLNILMSTVIEPKQTDFFNTRTKAASLLGQQVGGGFMPGLQEAAYGGPQTLQQFLQGANQQFGVESSLDPATGQYTAGISSAGHPYINQKNAVNIQDQLSQAVNQAMQASQMFQALPPEISNMLRTNFETQQRTRNEGLTQQMNAFRTRQADDLASYQGLGY